MIKDHGDELRFDSQVYYAFPTPETLSKLTKEQLRESGLSLRKAEYIIVIAKLITSGKLDLESCLDIKDVGKIIEKLNQLRGVGEWITHLTVLRGMHRHQAFPADDLGFEEIHIPFLLQRRKNIGRYRLENSHSVGGMKRFSWILFNHWYVSGGKVTELEKGSDTQNKEKNEWGVLVFN